MGAASGDWMGSGRRRTQIYTNRTRCYEESLSGLFA